ncbi:unnamed protein product [Adineta steineri]|uniref:EGF-like domain-containing protein n=1 Tax=Adineta steineri TaxID=433720 RepID=A0A814GNC2_9BILA|nr:unnamed protein product [Adineta steineri]CAF1111006.1 unnamed protein product [Adineta steineri]
METQTINAFDRHHTIYNNRTYVRTTYSSTRNQLYHPYLKPLPIPSVNLCDFLLYESKIAEDIGSATSLSYINNAEHYDNTYSHTYDNPIECFENYNIKQSLIDIPQTDGKLSDNIKDETVNDDEKSSHNKSSILYYLENKRLVFYACLISLLLLLLIGMGIFLLNKFIRPVVVTTTVNNHYDKMNLSNTSPMLTTSRAIITPTLIKILTQSSTTKSVTISTIEVDGSPFSYSMCPPEHWGIGCKNICKPCGLGVCHPVTGKCICPEGIYGEYCDLSKVNDKPKRGDMMS